MLKVALIGYGKMGKRIHALAPQAAVEIVAIIDSEEKLTKESIENADLCIDFSHPMTLLSNVQKVAALKKAIVIGTTGWYQNLDLVKKIVLENEIAAIYAENFSIGIQMFLKIVEKAAILINQQPEYDLAIHEVHHKQKVDSPSGTAELLADTVLDKVERKKRISMLSPKEDELALSSLRLGSVPGTHTFIMDSLSDTITLTHTARTRDGFALGALQAAKWLSHKKKGFYHLREIL